MKYIVMLLFMLPCLLFASKPQQEKKQIVVINGYCYKVYFDSCNILHLELQHDCDCGCPHAKEINLDTEGADL